MNGTVNLLVLLLSISSITPGVVEATPTAGPEVLLEVRGGDETPNKENALINGSEAKITTDGKESTPAQEEEKGDTSSKTDDTSYITECSSDGGDEDALALESDPGLGPLMENGDGFLTTVKINITAPMNEPIEGSEKASDVVTVPSATQSETVITRPEGETIVVNDVEDEVKTGTEEQIKGPNLSGESAPPQVMVSDLSSAGQ